VPAPFNHQWVELSELVSERLADPNSLSAVIVAAAGAIGMLALGPPWVRQGPAAIAICMLCRDGHIVLHAWPAEGVCVIDILARGPAEVGKGIEVIARRLKPTE
jgi:S-adenosylmethionine/arginine decarboxylase-like enzyme